VDVEAVQVFTSLLALAALAGSLVTLVAIVLRRRVPRAQAIVEIAADTGLWLAFLVAAVATAGSLYFSEVANYAPCRWCWFQRVAMYPLAVILLVAAVRRDRDVRWYVGPVAALGLVVSSYHFLLERYPSLDNGACAAVGPSCTDVWFREFGFVTLAFMAGAGFIAILTFAVLAPRYSSEVNP
jgi:disulfide bond formation protein DsbB